MGEGSWKLYLCSHRNLGGIVGIPAATSEDGEEEQQHQRCFGWIFGGIFLESWLNS